MLYKIGMEYHTYLSEIEARNTRDPLFLEALRSRCSCILEDADEAETPLTTRRDAVRHTKDRTSTAQPTVSSHSNNQ